MIKQILNNMTPWDWWSVAWLSLGIVHLVLTDNEVWGVGCIIISIVYGLSSDLLKVLLAHHEAMVGGKDG